MNPPRAAPPAADICLSRLYSSSLDYGGTIVDESVADLAAHLRKLALPDDYRPEGCSCGNGRLHAHGFRERCPRQFVSADGEPVPAVRIRVYYCPTCGATWRVLPAFLARWLWRSWKVIEREALGRARPACAPPVPTRTVQRWRARLKQSADLLGQALVVAGGALRELAVRVGLGCCRGDLVRAFGGTFAAFAALLHRLCPGGRLM